MLELPKHVVIEEVPCAGAEVAEVERPAAKRNGQSEFPLLVAFPVQGRKLAIERRTLLNQWSRNGQQRRSLVIPSPECARHPVQLWNLQSRANSRVHRIVDDARQVRSGGRSTPKMRQAHAAIQSQPMRDLKLILQKQSRCASPHRLPFCDGCIAAVTGDDAEELVVALAENLHAPAETMSTMPVGKRNYSSDIVRSAIILRDHHSRIRHAAVPADVVRSVEVVEGRNRQHSVGARRSAARKNSRRHRARSRRREIRPLAVPHYSAPGSDRREPTSRAAVGRSGTC